MVEPFGCVVMLHWRLHVYGASVPLSATPTGPSSLFYSPLSHALCSSLRALSSSSLFSHAFTDRYIPPSHPRTVDSPLKRNVIIGPCVIIVLPAVWQLHNSYQRGQRYNYAYMFLYIPPDIVRRYDRRLLKRLRQARNRKSIIGRSNGLIAIKSNDWNWFFDGSAVIENVRFFSIVLYLSIKYAFILHFIHLY